MRTKIGMPAMDSILVTPLVGLLTAIVTVFMTNATGDLRDAGAAALTLLADIAEGTARWTETALGVGT
jgi:hypothetical protein